jgi:hypothetical protein
MHEYYTLKALRDRASAEQVQQAEIDAAIAEHEAWKAAGRPGLKSHEEFMAEVSLADDPVPPGAFVRGACRRLRVGPYRVLYEVEGDLITIVRIDRV